MKFHGRKGRFFFIVLPFYFYKGPFINYVEKRWREGDCQMSTVLHEKLLAYVVNLSTNRERVKILENLSTKFMNDP